MTQFVPRPQRCHVLFVSFALVLCAGGTARGDGAAQQFVRESARQIPVVAEVDVVVVGSSTGAVAAAAEAARAGAKVFLVAPKSYLGEDVCASQRYWLVPGETPVAPLGKRLFGNGLSAGGSSADVPTPMHIKRTLDQTLLDAKVDFLYGCYATDVLRDAAGNPCGIVMANRGGRQAVLAKVIIDATPRATVARLAGAKFAPYPAGAQVFQRVVIGASVETVPGDSVRKLPVGRAGGKGGEDAAVYEYTLRIEMADGSWGAFAAAEQIARDRTFHKDQLESSEVLFQVPPDPMKGAAHLEGEWAGDKAPLDALRPQGIARFFVLGGCADVSREAAAALVRPLALIDLGTRVGAAAAAEAKPLPAVTGAKIPGQAITPAVEGDIKELLVGVRPMQSKLPTVPAEARGLPVLGSYDVVVIGGGTAGAPAGIGAARQKAKTLVIEALHELGGTGTLGSITGYYSGYREGFTAEVTAALQQMGVGKAANWSAIGKAEYWRTANRKAGAEIWYNTQGVGAFVEGGRVRGIVVATPLGRGVVLAKAVVDGTGSSDIAIAAGAAYRFVDATEPAVQGAGLQPLKLGMRGSNTDYTFSDDTDMLDYWQLNLSARAKAGAAAYDLGQLPQTRERRRIVGEVTLMPMDLILNRAWPDAIAVARSHFDTHGFTVHPMFWARQPDIEAGSGEMFVPLRAIMPRGLSGIMVVGIGLSAHRDVMPILRMQASLQNLGYAAGVASAMNAAGPLDLPALQKHLVEKGCLPNEAVGQKDSFPLPEQQVREAVANVVKGSRLGHIVDTDWQKRKHMVDGKYNGHDIAVLFAHPTTALPLLEKAYAAASTPADKLLYAHLLGILGSPAGVETLLARVQAAEDFDDGWNFKGMAQYGRNMSELDQFIIALGQTRNHRAVEPILAKLARLDAQKEFSHHRACALALETLADPRAAKPLADLLAKPGMTGYAAATLDAMSTRMEKRSESLRELMLARALYRCGDHNNVGRKILESYAQDLRGPYARHAQATVRSVLHDADRDPAL